MPHDSGTRLIRLWLQEEGAEGSVRAAAYRIADQELWCDEPLAAAGPFRVATPAPAARRPQGPWRRGASQPIYRGPALVGGHWLELELAGSDRGFELLVGDVAGFEIASDGDGIRAFRGPRSVDRPLFECAVLGPALLLALAIRDRWALHASAAALPTGVVGFLGGSGVGKSTLAAGLAAAGTRWRPVADDLLPLRLDGSGVVALPRYPQLKLDRQWGPELPPALPLEALFLLQPRSAGEGGRVELRRVEARRATTLLASSTFVKFLFDRRLLGAHLTLCSEVARRVPTYSIAYPRRRAAIDEIGESVAERVAPG